MRENFCITPVILCGGEGSRLWPLSNDSRPKQFITLPGLKNSLLQNTLLRLRDVDYLKPPIIVLQKRFLEQAEEQIKAVDASVSQIITESELNGTAFAVSLAISWIKNRKDYMHNQEIILIMPVDHYLENPSELFYKINLIAPRALDKIISFGIYPQKMECEYGYIQVTSNAIENEFQRVIRFIEKPSLVQLQELMNNQFFYWNSGIFLSGVDLLSKKFDSICFDILHAADKSLKNITSANNVMHSNAEPLENKASLDHALIAKADDLFMQFLNTPWYDLGHINSAWEVSAKDQYGNFSSGNTVLMDTQNSYIVSDCKPTAVIGLNDIVVINTDEAVLVADKFQSNHAKSLFYQFKSSSKNKDTKPWGHAINIEIGESFAIKKLKIAPSQRTSLQLHEYRSEYLIVIEGSAFVIVGNQSYILNPGDGIHVPQNTIHRISNNDKNELFIVEVQTGSMISDNDIVRIQDDYGRCHQEI